MKNEKLLKAMGRVKEEFIEEAAPVGKVTTEIETERMLQVSEDERQQDPLKKQKNSRSWVKWVALAACGALVICIGGTKVFRAINDDTRSFWPEAEEEQYDGQKDRLTAVTTTDTGIDTAVDFTSGADEGFPDWGLTLSAKDVTPTGLTLVCTRKGGNPTGEIECGTDYHLIVLEDGTWKDVPTVIEEYAWNSLAYWITEGQDTEFSYSWEWLYGKLPAGTYRLTKGFMDFRGTADYDTAVYWVEFEIE